MNLKFLIKLIDKVPLAIIFIAFSEMRIYRG
jgi:hypothetical protein